MYTVLWSQDDSKRSEQTVFFKNNTYFITFLQK